MCVSTVLKLQIWKEKSLFIFLIVKVLSNASLQFTGFRVSNKVKNQYSN